MAFLRKLSLLKPSAENLLTFRHSIKTGTILNDECVVDKKIHRDIKPDEVKEYECDPTAIVIDLRLAEDSCENSIKNSINIPLKELKGAFEMAPDEFRRQYCKHKPCPYAKVLFVDDCGKDIGAATKVAREICLTNLYGLEGGMVGYGKYLDDKKCKEEQTKQKAQSKEN